VYVDRAMQQRLAGELVVTPTRDGGLLP